MITSNKLLKLPPPISDLPSHWEWIRLEEVCLGTYDCPHSTPQLTEKGPFVVRSQDILTGVFRLETAAHVSDETYQERIARAEPQYGDILYSREGTYFGIAAEVPPQTRVCLGQRMMLFHPNPELIHFRFLRYWLNSPVMAAYIHGFRDGTVAERLNLPVIRSLPIPVPPLDEQRAIAHILGSLDDKIELNRQMNATLEAAARAIFQSWFVDFDPVHAKANGEQPMGMDAETAALFPDSFEESELELIPRGWRVGTIADVARVNGWTLSKRDNLDLIEYIEISEVSRGEIGEIQVYERGSEPSRARRRLQHGDTVLSTVRPDRQAYFLCLNPSVNLIASTGFATFTPTDAPWSYTYLALTRIEVFERLGLLADGAAYPAVAPEVIAEETIFLPNNQELLSVFHHVCAPLLQQAAANKLQSRTLAELRDVLLPKLISGEIRVGEAEYIPEKLS